MNNHPMGPSFKHILNSGTPIRGIFSGLNSPVIIEMSAYAGFDFVIIDNEHGTSGYESTEYLLRTANSCAIPAVIRSFPHDIARLLDAGATAIQVPMIESAVQVKSILDMMRYPPAGHRGVAFSSRAAGYGAFGGPSHMDRSNKEIALIAMIETPKGVENAYEIACVEGVDAVFIGPNDLAGSCGFGCAWREQPTKDLIAKIIKDVKRANKPVGILAIDSKDKASFGEIGADYFVTVASSVLTQALKKSKEDLL